MKTVGIIGGLGPETTAEFYLKLIFSSFEKDKKKRPPVLIWSIPLEYQLEQDFITKAKGIEKYIPYLQDAARRLENGGADFIVIPCNSVHLAIDAVRQVVKIPVLSIVEETEKFLTKRNIQEIALLATNPTIKTNLYNLKNIKIHLPQEHDQEKIGQLINNLVRSRYNKKDRTELIKIIQKFAEKDIKHVVLACTDLQLLAPTYAGTEIFDSMAILAEATIEKILKC